MASDYKLPLPGCRVQQQGNPVNSDDTQDTDDNLRLPHRRLIELRIEHADLDNLIDRAEETHPVDELALRRLKKRRLMLRDHIAKLEAEVDPPEPA